MPIYEYRCENGHSFEVLQGISDDPVTTCEQCGAPVERVLHPVAVHFKGTGFYSTDYAGKGKAERDGKGDGASESGGGSKESKSESKSEKKSDSGSKSESKTGSGSSGGSSD